MTHLPSSLAQLGHSTHFRWFDNSEEIISSSSSFTALTVSLYGESLTGCAEPVSMACSITEVLPDVSIKTSENTSSTPCNVEC